MPHRSSARAHPQPAIGVARTRGGCRRPKATPIPKTVTGEAGCDERPAHVVCAEQCSQMCVSPVSLAKQSA